MNMISEDEVQRRISKKTNNKIIMIDGYSRVNDKALMQCNVCKHKWEISPIAIYRRSKTYICPKCKDRMQLTVEEVQQRISNSTNNNIRIISEYKGTNYKAMMHCNRCNYEWRTAPITVYRRSKYGCPKCNNKIKLTLEEVQKRIYSSTNSNIKIISGYKGTNYKAMMHCNRCNYEWMGKPQTFYRKKPLGCPKCDGRKKYNVNNVRKLILQKSDGNILLKDMYTSVSKKALFICNICYYEWMAPPINFYGKRKYGCPKCNNRIKITTDDFKKRVYALVGNDYEVVSEYKNNRTKVKMFHNKCKSYFLMTPNSFLDSDSRCPICGGVYQYNTNEVKEKVLIEFKGEYEMLGKYVNHRTKIAMKHNKCGHVWNVLSYNFFNGHGCPHCNRSRGERVIYDWLDSHKIVFQPQFVFNDCKNKAPLPFDFATFDINGNVKYLIEFQGAQHYREWYFDNLHSNNNSFITRKKNDKIKKEYCLKHKLSLIEIIDHNQSISWNNLKKLVNDSLTEHFNLD